MTKTALIALIASKTGSSKRLAGDMVNAFLEGVTDSLKKGEKVTLTGFGTFKISHRAARNGVNPRTGEALKIAAMNLPTFKSGKALKDAVRNS